MANTNQYLKIFTTKDELVKRLDELEAEVQAIITSAGLVPETVGEIPSGAIDGVNQTFTTVENFLPDTLKVNINGIRDYDYTITASNEFELVTFVPQVGTPSDVISVDYVPDYS